MDFPRTIEEITPEWLTQVLRDSGAIRDASVESIEHETIGDGDGAWSDVRRIALDYDHMESAAPKTVIAKTGFQSELIVQNPVVRDIVATINRREALFYQDLAVSCGLGTPKHHFSSYDMETAEVIYILEDGGHLRSVNQSDNCSLEDAQAALLSLANMHCKWWNNEELNGHDWLRVDGTNGPPEIVQERFAQTIDAFFEFVKDRVPVGLETVARKLLPKLVEVSDELVTTPVTLVHGDYRLGNLFFDDSLTIENRVVAFDWQTVGRARCADDISSFMSTSFDVEFRRQYEQQLLVEYHSALLDGGVTGYSYDRFLNDVRLYLLPNLARRINSIVSAIDTIQTSEERSSWAWTMIERLQMTMDWNCDEVIPK